MSEDHGYLPATKVRKPSIKWKLGLAPRQGNNECNIAALCSWLRCSPNLQVVDYRDVVKDCYELVKTPNGSQLPDVLDQAVEHGYIKGYVNDDEPDLGFLKALLHHGPVLVGMEFFSSFYGWQQNPLEIGGEQQGGHTWLAHTVNFNKKFVGMSSWWGNNAVYQFPFEVLRVMFARTEKDRQGKEHFTSEIYQPYL